MSDKFRSSLVNKIEEKRAFEEKQNNLKEKHGIEEENVIVVEKTNMISFYSNGNCNNQGCSYDKHIGVGCDWITYCRVSGIKKSICGIVNFVPGTNIVIC